METDSYNPVIVIGAARSGTNMLRDILTKLPDFGTWDCDEINPIWRYGNLNAPSDVFSAEMARPEVARYIQGAFAKIALKQGVANVVEKSCANSLRIPFVDAIFPKARYLFIVRDGRDTVVSAEERWKASFDPVYAAKKLRYVPWSDLPIYAARFGFNRIRQLLSKENRLSFWGVQLDVMDELLQQCDLQEVCALQWKMCVEKSAADLKALAPERTLQVKYEDFVREPVQELERILPFLGVDSKSVDCELLVSGVRATSVGRYRDQLAPKTLEKVELLMRDTLRDFDYVI